ALTVSSNFMNPLKSTTTVLLFIFFICGCGPENGGFAKDEMATRDLNGLYVGLEEIGVTIDPSRPERKWYHLGNLIIKGDSAFLDQSPVSIYKNDTSFSASDGAFYYYSGTYKAKDSTLIFKFKMDRCDYCAREVRKLKNGKYEEIEKFKELVAIRKPQGLLIKNYLYEKKDNK
ncbi:MAG TPA: hypothetical protein VGB63_05480, partial [Pedobacter sp.]